MYPINKSASAVCALGNLAAGTGASDRTIRENVEKVWTAPKRR